MILPGVRDSFPTAGGDVTTERGMTAVSDTGERLFFRDCLTASAYTESVFGRGQDIELHWLSEYSRGELGRLMEER